MDKKKLLKRFLYVVLSIILALILLSIGVYIGYSHRPEIDKVNSVMNKNPQTGTSADFAPFWKVWNVLNEKSIYAKDATDQERVWGAISGLASSLKDPYTVFFPPDDNKSFKQEIKGSFEGIGAEIGIKDDILTVIAPLKDTPAWRSGLKSGDKIIKIDDKITNDMTIDQAIDLIRGQEGTIVSLTILREGERETRVIKITRQKINIPTIDTEMRDDGIFVIKLYSFSESSDILFKDALLKFLDSKSDKLILDLRGNPGGYLESSVNIASWFIDEGKVVVQEDFGDKMKPKVYRSHGPKLFNEKLSFIILVDGGSASASEILAGALSEQGVAKLVGEKTFGKGSVQELINITDDTSIKITIAKWLTPGGRSISEKGLEPDYKVHFTMDDYKNKKDPQMDKAVELLLKK